MELTAEEIAQQDADLERLLAMTDEEVLADAEARGVDVKALVRDQRARMLAHLRTLGYKGEAR